jgi:hypothetical protein
MLGTSRKVVGEPRIQGVKVKDNVIFRHYGPFVYTFFQPLPAKAGRLIVRLKATKCCG